MIRKYDVRTRQGHLLLIGKPLKELLITFGSLDEASLRMKIKNFKLVLVGWEKRDV